MPVSAMGEKGTPPPPAAKPSMWHRFLDGRTSGQRFVLSLGALAGALLAIGALVAAVGALVDDDDDERTPPGVAVTAGEQVVENQSEEADEFVGDLLATNGAPVQLNTKVLAPDEGSHVRLEYDCGKQTGCSFTRLEMGSFIPDRIPGGVWYQGCYSVVKEGAGYGAEHLDLEFTESGPTCPS